MTSTPSIAIVGGGAAGLSTAMYTAELGFTDIVVFEARHPAEGSSGRSAGIFNRQTNKMEELQLRAFGGRELDRLSTWSSFSLVRRGYVRVAKTEEHMEAYAAARALQDELGVPGELLDQAGLAALVPGMRVDDFVGGLYGAEDGHMDGHELCEAFRLRAVELGAQVRNRTSVAHSEQVGSQVRLIGTDNSDLGTYDIVVNAAGPSGPLVAEALGVRQNIVNERHQICMVEFEDRPERRIPAVQTYVPGSGQESLWVRTEGPGSLLAGLHTQEIRDTGETIDPENFNEKVDMDYAEAVGEEIVSRFEGWDDLRLAGGWSGLYPVSADGRFQIGPYHDRPNIISVGGLGGVGLTNAPAVGRTAAEWIVNGEPTTFSFATELVPDRASLYPEG
ncbi:FAD-dependent oxidoreductase [Nocardioides sp. NPDC006303]|uniref:NAD(P)/FAD-dependent oxidoreductase n=1 Tax=Nocardioides sp. NPDC006303 TaxID=3156747 RepID=UPI0033AA4FAE